MNVVTGDRYTDRWSATRTGSMCVSDCREMVRARGKEEVELDFDRAAEIIYMRLPSGDYGRGDVKRVLRAVLVDCPNCDGTGDMPTGYGPDMGKPCASCDGSGKVK